MPTKLVDWLASKMVKQKELELGPAWEKLKELDLEPGLVGHQG